MDSDKIEHASLREAEAASAQTITQQSAVIVRDGLCREFDASSPGILDGSDRAPWHYFGAGSHIPDGSDRAPWHDFTAAPRYRRLRCLF